MNKNRTLLITALIASLSAPMAFADSNEVHLYSARKENLIKPALDEFTKATGITVKLNTADANELLSKLKTEGKDTSADVFLTVDAGRLQAAKDADVLQPIQSKILEERIPAELRDKDNQWFGLSARARVIVYNTSAVKPSDLSSYEDLTNPKWKGRICVRGSGNIYNQSLLASIIARDGEEAALEWAKGIVANMARKPQGNDRDQMKGAAIGVCDVAIVNTYYFGRMQNSKSKLERDAASQLAVFYPNQKDRGAHINVSGAGVTKYAKNKQNAIKLLEFLTSHEAQKFYAEVNFEYPVIKGVPVSESVKSWGWPFKQDTISINALGENNAEAVKIFDRAGWK